MRLEIQVEVDTDIKQVVEQHLSSVLDTLTGTLMEQAEITRARSMEIVPVDQGVLRASALAVGVSPTRKDDSIEVAIGYGGAASSYALIQHETPPDVFSHAPGQSWKYLERPMLESAAEFRDAITEASARVVPQ